MNIVPSWQNLDAALVSGVGSFVRCLNYFEEITNMGFKGRLELMNGSYNDALVALRAQS